MPRNTMLPTPASSTEIKVQDSTKQLSSLQMSFELPPSAIDSGAASQRMSPPSPKAPFPMQPSETVKSRRRSSAALQQKEAFSLPPPPTRSRKIIQMKPRVQEDKKKASKASETSSSSATTPTATAKNSNSGNNNSTTATASGSNKNATAGGGSGTGGKKKQPSATSAAGRKIARKTAHSLIERRRRSKMNEEFAVLKGLIPACTGEMHKLAILQASIDYVRYLEDCISKLKAQREAGDSGVPSSEPAEDFRPSPSNTDDLREEDEELEDGAYDNENEDGDRNEDESNEEQSEDVEMMGSETAPSPIFTADPSHPHARSQSHSYSNFQPYPTYQQPHQPQRHPSISPALLPQDTRDRQHSYSSVSTTAEYPRHYSSSTGYGTTSSMTSPTVPGSRHSGGAYPPYGSTSSAPHSALTSPALAPQPEDQEATAALLMLNADRRGLGSGGGGGSSSGGARGMSVRDLLSS